MAKPKLPGGSLHHRRVGDWKSKTLYWKWLAAGIKRWHTEESDEGRAIERCIEHYAKLGMRGPREIVKGAPITWAEAEELLIARWKFGGKTGMLEASSAVFAPIRAAFAKMPLAKMRGKVLDDYAAARQRAGYANATINQELKNIRRAKTLAYEEGRLAEHDISKLRKLPEDNEREDLVTADVWTKVGPHLSRNYREVLLGCFESGWRENEILKLEWERVDLDGELPGMRLRPRNSRKDEKHRWAPLLREGDFYPALVARRAERKEGDGFVFPGRKPGRPLDASGLQRAWRAACIEAGLETEETPEGQRLLIHGMRRAMRTEMGEAFVDPKVAQAALGHTKEMSDRYNRVRKLGVMAAYEAVMKKRKAS